MSAEQRKMITSWLAECMHNQNGDAVQMLIQIIEPPEEVEDLLAGFELLEYMDLERGSRLSGSNALRLYGNIFVKHEDKFLFGLQILAQYLFSYVGSVEVLDFFRTLVVTWESIGIEIKYAEPITYRAIVRQVAEHLYHALCIIEDMLACNELTPQSACQILRITFKL